MKALKVVSIVSTVGAIAGGAATLALTKTSNNNIVERFREIGYDLLDTNKDDGWEEILAEYSKAPDNEIFEGGKKTKADLKAKCRETLNKKSTNDKDYSLAKRWCTRQETIQAMIGRLGFKPLDTSKNTNDPVWRNKVTELINTGNNKVKFGGGITGKIEVDVVTVWTVCQSIEHKNKDMKTTNKEYEEEFIKAREWCSTK